MATTTRAKARPSPKAKKAAKGAATPPARRGGPAPIADATSPADARLRELCAGYDYDLYKAAGDGLRLKTGSTTHLVTTRHRMGAIVRRQYDKHEADGRRGREVIDILAEAWGEAREQVRLYRRFAVAFTDEQVSEFLALRTPQGQGLSWSHLEFSMAIVDPARRTALLRKAAEKALGANAFLKEVNKAAGLADPDGDGRSRPMTLHLVVSQLARRSRALLEFAGPAVIDRLGELADEIPANGVTDEQLAEVDAALGELAAIEDQAAAAREELAATRKRLAQRQALHPPAAKAAPAGPAPRVRLEPGRTPVPPAPPIRPKRK